jgi:enamine deaminase RidA (YjgF/YER057c/UK114 family)
MEILQPGNWPRPKGYSYGAAARGRLIFVAGTCGWDLEGNFAAGFTAQTRQALTNIVAVLAEARARPEHIVRLTWYVIDKRQYLAELRELGAAYREVIGAHYPPMALVQVSALVQDRALVEIEATAVVPD